MGKAKKDMQELEHLKSEFISIAAHKLRTPLSIAKEGIDLIMDEVAGEMNDQQKKLVAAAQENINKLNRTVSDILDMSMIEAGKLVLKKEKIDARDLLQRLALSFKPGMEREGLELKVVPPEGKIDIYADPERILQVFANLIKNAVRFTRKGSIEISIGDKGSEIECSVADTGIGIPEEDLADLFSRFKKLEYAEAAGEKGSGLELSIAKNLVEMHGGVIRAESKTGKGSKFIFTLPKAKE
jgi:signal transduction histidine kinase